MMCSYAAYPSFQHSKVFIVQIFNCRTIDIALHYLVDSLVQYIISTTDPVSRSHSQFVLIGAYNVYTNSGFSLSVKSNHSWFSSFMYPGLALNAAFFLFWRRQYHHMNAISMRQAPQQQMIVISAGT